MNLDHKKDRIEQIFRWETFVNIKVQFIKSLKIKKKFEKNGFLISYQLKNIQKNSKPTY